MSQKLKYILTATISVVVTIVAIVGLVGSNQSVDYQRIVREVVSQQGTLGGFERFPNSDLSAKSINSTASTTLGGTLVATSTSGLVNGGWQSVIRSGVCADATTTLASGKNPYGASSTIPTVVISTTGAATGSIAYSFGTTSSPTVYSVSTPNANNLLIKSLLVASNTLPYIVNGRTASSSELASVAFPNQSITIGPEENWYLFATGSVSDSFGGASILGQDNTFQCEYKVILSR